MLIKFIRLCLAFIVFVVLLGVGTTYYLHQWLHKEISVNAENKIFLVKKGESPIAISNRLQDRGLIRWPVVWRYYSQYFDKKPILAGEFKFADNESPLTILTRLQSNQVVTYSIGWPEGVNYRELLQLLSENESLKHELSGLAWEDQKKLLSIEVDHPEGQFFPDTYQFIRGDTDVDILKRAHEKMKQILNRHWANKTGDLPYTSAYEVLIMASIIEKETGRASEREQIAGVFVRRLKKKMRLQTDPTVIYGLGESFDGNLTRAHLKQQTPYNTYRIKGLPPTPIAMPGEDSIRAALNPDSGKSLYFVAKGDGSHKFSDTLEEHNSAVKQFQHKRRKDYRSSP